MNAVKERQSNFELLRIIAMLLIVAGHFYYQTSGHHQDGGFLIVLLSSGSRVAVNLFLMIGVWFMVDKNFESRRLFKIWNTVWFWSVLLTMAVVILGVRVSFYNCITAYFPVLFYKLWFASVYFVLLLMSPLLDIFCRALAYGGGKLCMWLSILFIIVVGQSTIHQVEMDTLFCSTTYFLFMYIVMWFYKRGYIVISINKWLMLFMGLSFYLILVVIAKGNFNLPSIFGKVCEKFLSDYKTLPNLIISFCVFYFFMLTKLGRIKIINLLSSVSFGVYVIHQLPDFHDFFWLKIVRIDEWGYSSSFDILFFIGVFAIYIVCGGADFCRQKFVEKYLLKMRCVNVMLDTVNNSLRMKPLSSGDNKETNNLDS